MQNHAFSLPASEPQPALEKPARLTRRVAPASPAHRIPRVRRAVEACTQAWSSAYAQALESNFPQDQALRMAAVAYKLQIPKMDGFLSIKSAFACITHGIALEVFEGNQGSQLLYAAQVAASIYYRKGGKK